METRKFMVGRIRLKPGQSAAFMEFAKRYVSLSQQDEGCLFFDMVPSAEDKDEIIFVECFRDEAAHQAHTPHFAEGKQALQRLARGVRVDNIFAREVKAECLNIWLRASRTLKPPARRQADCGEACASGPDPAERPGRVFGRGCQVSAGSAKR